MARLINTLVIIMPARHLLTYHNLPATVYRTSGYLVLVNVICGAVAFYIYAQNTIIHYTDIYCVLIKRMPFSLDNTSFLRSTNYCVLINYCVLTDYCGLLESRVPLPSGLDAFDTNILFCSGYRVGMTTCFFYDELFQLC